jgi:hypothetical protein
MIDIAVMVEPRLHEYLKSVIDNMLRNLNKETPIMIFHSTINKDFIYNNYINELNSNKIILSLLKQTNLTIKQYNMLLTSVDFWNKINGEHILIFQTDSCLCRHISTFNFTDYKDYGFIGAPCKIKEMRNGGFSLRKKSIMIKIIKHHQSIYNNSIVTVNEDKFFTNIYRNICKPVSYDLGLKFSVEQFYYNNPLGIHKAWRYLSKEKWEELKNNLPEISLTFNLL